MTNPHINYQPYNPLEQVSQEENVKLQKRLISDLFDSYNSEWDVLIELVQNAVDALEQKFEEQGSKEKPILQILLNDDEKSITVTDNGTGIDPEDAKKILAPTFSLKDPESTARGGRRSYRGHKGVGLTYIAYSSSKFRLFTKRDGQLFSGEMDGAWEWVNDPNSKSAPTMKPAAKLFPELLLKSSSGTSFEVQIPEKMYKEMKTESLLANGWEFILRTRTAIGIVDLVNDLKWPESAKVQFKIEKRGNITAKEEFPFGYLFPNEILKNKALDLSKYYSDHPESPAIPKGFQNRYLIIYKYWHDSNLILEKAKGYEEFVTKHRPKIYAMFANSSNIWKLLDQGYSNKARKFWKPGIQFVTESMPTGNPVTVSLEFGAGNKDRILLLLQLEGARPDIGRKIFHREVEEFGQAIAKDIVTEFVKNRGFLKPAPVTHGGNETEREFTLQSSVDSARQKEKLGLLGVAFQNVPSYEQDVVALFHELVGRQKVLGYKTLSMSTASQYDGIIDYFLRNNTKDSLFPDNPLGVPRVNFSDSGEIKLPSRLMEFKMYLSDLKKDIDSEEKRYEDIAFVVAWEVGPKEVYGDSLLRIDEESIDQRRFHCVTHVLHYSETGRINVIILKDVVAALRKQQ